MIARVTRLLVAFTVLLGICVSGCGPKGARVALNDQEKQAFADLLELSKTMPPDNDLPAEFTAIVSDSSSGPPSEEAAYILVSQGDYAKAYDQWQRLAVEGNAEDQAKAHLGLGKMYYDLALLDMVNRHLFTQNRVGFLVLKPDDQAKLVFSAAQKEFAEGIRLAEGTPPDVRDRQQQTDRYLEGKTTALGISRDQSQSSMWLTKLSEQRPEFLGAAKRALLAAGWVLFFQKPPPMFDPQLPAIREQRLAEIYAACPSGAEELHVIYDLGCFMSFWVGNNAMSRSQNLDAARKEALKENLKSLGEPIQQAADLLKIPLSESAQALLKGEESPDGLKELMLGIETGLQTNYSSRCLWLYVLVNNECTLTGFSARPELSKVFGPMIGRIAPQFAQWAGEAGGDDAMQAEILALGKEEVTPATAVKVSAVTGRLVTHLVDEIVKTDQWHQ